MCIKFGNLIKNWTRKIKIKTLITLEIKWRLIKRLYELIREK